MGLLDKLLKKPTSEPVSADQTVNLSKDLGNKISLRKEIVLNEVKKQNISSNNARVVFALDHSGSMRSMYKNGTVQDLLERIFPLAMHFDDNSEMEFYWFDNLFKELEPVNLLTLEGYVDKVINSKDEHFGGTCYAPIMNEIFTRYAKREPMNIPTFVIFITDGNNSDKKATKDVLTEASKYNIFWKYVGIGNEQFEFLEKLDTLKNRYIDNANFIRINDIAHLSDEQLYCDLLTEYNDWLQLCRNHRITVD